MIRTYSELVRFQTFEARFDYLQLGGTVCVETFGSNRWMNQQFYRSREWKLIRSEVIARDLGYDLGIEDFPVRGTPQIHHMNPLQIQDIVHSTDNLLDPEFLITTSHRTHNAIHYGDRSHLPRVPNERRPGDHAPWREPQRF